MIPTSLADLNPWIRKSGINLTVTDPSTAYKQILALSDPNARWSAQLGLSVDLSARDFGIRTARYALVLDDLKIVYLGVSRLVEDWKSFARNFLMWR